MLFKILKVLLAPVRLVLGAGVRLYDGVLTPRPLIQRDPARQAQVDGESAGLTLYHFQACPFCVKVRRQMKRLGLNIPMRDVKREPGFARELVEGGGEMQVPCLRIALPDGKYQWMYESSDINEYLSRRFGT